MAGFGYNLLTPLAVISNSADTPLYPASNLLSSAVDKPWRAAGTGARTIDFDFGVATAIDGVMVNDANIASIGVATGDTLGALTNQTAITLYRASHGRYKGLSRFIQTKRYVRLTFNAATTDGLAYYRGGAVLFWSTWLSMVPPNFGISADLIKAQARNVPSNQRVSIARIAAPLDEIKMTYEHKLSEVGPLADFIEKATVGTVIYNLEHSFRPAYMWPLRIVDDRSAEVMDKVRLATRQLTCLEVA